MPGIELADLVSEAQRILDSLGQARVSATAYDTAWLARVPRASDEGEPLFPESYDWLIRHQHDDGWWGGDLAFPHDRLISTLAATVTLAGARFRRAESEPAVRRAVVYLNREHLNVRDDPAETVGFELLLPELMRQAQRLGLQLPYQEWAFVDAIKADKLQRIPPIAVYGGPTPLTFSLEYLGDGVSPLLVERCRSFNGSYGASPSATGYVHFRSRARRRMHICGRSQPFRKMGA
jgi:halimadienyl-diphosphate synthase